MSFVDVLQNKHSGGIVLQRVQQRAHLRAAGDWREDVGQIFCVAGGEFIQPTARSERVCQARGEPEMVAIEIRAGDEEDAGSLLRWAGDVVSADLCRKSRDGGILADKVLLGLGGEFAQGLIIREGAVWHLESLSRKGFDGSVSWRF